MSKESNLFIASNLASLSLIMLCEGLAMEKKPIVQGSKRAYSTTISDSEEGSTEEPKEKKAKFTESDSEIIPFTNYAEDIQFLVIKQVAIGKYAIGDLRMVCKTWHKIIKDNKATLKQSIDDAVYGRFLNGRLIYKPNEDNDVGKVEFRIADLASPLEGTFDLSQCGDAGNGLSISTGYRKEKKAENEKKIEIWLAPRFLIERELGTTAEHFKPIMDSWKQEQAPVGIFWTRGGDDLDDYDYLTTHDMDNLSKINLYENWNKSNLLFGLSGVRRLSHPTPMIGEHFHVSF